MGFVLRYNVEAVTHCFRSLADLKDTNCQSICDVTSHVSWLSVHFYVCVSMLGNY